MSVSDQKTKSAFYEVARIMVSLLSLSYGAVLILQFLLYWNALTRITSGNLVFRRFHFSAFFLDFTVSAEVFFTILLFALWLLYFGCFVIAWIGPTRNFFDAIRQSRLEGRLPTENALFSTAILSSLILSGVWSIQIAQELGGIPTGEIRFPDPFVALISLSISPIIEEIFFRLLPIGIPVVIHLVWARRQILDMSIINSVALLGYALAFPGKIRKELQLRTIGRLDYATITVSSFLFGVTHILTGAGWEVGKVSTSFLAGAVFALGYLKYGFHVPVLLHWFFNVYWTSLSMAYQLALEGVDNLSALLFLLYMVAGYITWMILIVRLLRRIKRIL
ncbi:MAG: CPBP family intramembrane metalloprotease [Candidatus Bathyarchaeota archaeon]|nr:MAG: CPBP family intramembrane metalloprotease [Candidatus Bathyarchaeota archaeon]